jgi:F-type H+/Na+-transporting ATPase subunit beta
MNNPQRLVGDGLLGRVIDASGMPLDGRGAIEDVHPAAWAAPQRGSARPPVLWETGIKVVDVYAPVALGGTVALLAQPGVGLMVFVHELIYRLAAQRGGCAVMTKLDHARNAVQEVAGELRESGVEQHTVLVAGRSAAAPAERRQVVATALSAAEDFVVRGRDVLLIVDDGLAIPETIDLLTGRARSADHGTLTVLLCFWQHSEPEPAVAPEVVPLMRDVQTRLVFSRDLALQAIWPAIDALQSHATLLDPAHVAVEHLSVAADARALLHRDAQRTDGVERERAEKLLLFQAQPFFVAEPFTALPAEFVPHEESIRDFQAILDGTYDAVASETLRFIGGARRPSLS